MKFISISLTVGSVVASMVGIILWLTGSEVAAAVVLTATVLLWLIVVVITTVGVTTWWTRQTMQQGAELVLRSQDINDRWDASKISSLAALMREGARMGRAEVSKSTAATPMLPSNEQNWLPELVEFNTPVIEVEEREQ